MFCNHSQSRSGAFQYKLAGAMSQCIPANSLQERDGGDGCLHTHSNCTPMRNWEDSLQPKLALNLFFSSHSLLTIPSEILILGILSLKKTKQSKIKNLLECNIAPTLCSISATQKIIDVYTAKYPQGQAYRAHFPVWVLGRVQEIVPKISMKVTVHYSHLEVVFKLISKHRQEKSLFICLKN